MNVKELGRGCGHHRLRVYGNAGWSLLSSQLIFHKKSSQAYSQASPCYSVLYGNGFLPTQVTLLSTPAVRARVPKCLQRQHLSNESVPPYLDVRHSQNTSYLVGNIMEAFLFNKIPNISWSLSTWESPSSLICFTFFHSQNVLIYKWINISTPGSYKVFCELEIKGSGSDSF